MTSKHLLIVVAAFVMAIPLVATNDRLEGRRTEPRNDVVLLNQGWSTQDRLRYYYTSQGSAAMSYDILLNLETASGLGLFRADENMTRYGLIPQPADPKYNPDGLPIGVTKTVVTDGRWKGEWVGLGCAACHNGLLEYNGRRVSISGGNNNKLDVHALAQELDDAVAATLADSGKFARLAERMVQRSTAGKEQLRKRLQTQAAVIHHYRSRTALTPSVVGPGRMDALRLIHNRVQATAMGVPENWVALLAPAKPSFVWNLPQSAWTQWTGILADPLARNGGESMGVFAQLDLTSKTPAEGLFESTLDLKGLTYSEALLRRLAPPPWPEEIFGTIDRAKAARGKELFAKNCAQCHSTWPHRWSEPKQRGKRLIENAIVSGEIVGTDPTVFSSPQFQSQPTSMAGPLKSRLDTPFTGVAVAPPPVVFSAASRGVIGRALAKAGLSEAELLSAHGFREVYPAPEEPVPALGAYKANPAEGMWSSPPFLHNGSVPNLYELLIPARERSKTFFIGREYDPIKVGVDVTGKSGKFQFDTRLVGNSNAGHSFENGPAGKGVIGPLLTDDERWAIIEYMKSLPSQPAQISPFGGPADPVRAWADTSFFHVKHPGTYNGAPTMPTQRGAASPPPRPPSELGLAQERIEPSEDSLIEIVKNVSIDRLRKQFPRGVRPVLRDAHPKMHGLVRAEFTVLDGLPANLRYGVFRAPRTFAALIRFSGGGIEAKPDTVPQGAGMAIKLLGVEGEKILDAERNAKTQDFVMIDFATFFVKDLADYVILHEAFAKGTPETFFKTRPEELAAIKAIRDQPLFNPLQVRYFSQTPFKLGPHAMKFSAKPRQSMNARPATMGPDFKRDAMIKQLGAGDVYFDFLVQLQTDAVKMPIENPLVIWDEALSPFQRVAVIRIPKQDISAKSWQEFGENLAFDPWHALPEHRPLGSMNRARRTIYEALSDFRHKANGVSRQEPTTIPPPARRPSRP